VTLRGVSKLICLGLLVDYPDIPSAGSPSLPTLAWCSSDTHPRCTVRSRSVDCGLVNGLSNPDFQMELYHPIHSSSSQTSFTLHLKNRILCNNWLSKETVGGTVDTGLGLSTLLGIVPSQPVGAIRCCPRAKRSKINQRRHPRPAEMRSRHEGTVVQAAQQLQWPNAAGHQRRQTRPEENRIWEGETCGAVTCGAVIQSAKQWVRPLGRAGRGVYGTIQCV
jgi:hypothetical protein